jgi:site-specific DNA-methyltransferase (adenine-specific)
MPAIPDGSVDMILCDLPYGTTACKWDHVIPFEPLWDQYKRIIKPSGAIALFGSEPFASHLRMSNLKWYKYDWVWDKRKSSTFIHARRMPHNTHELISIFINGTCFYYPQKVKSNGRDHRKENYYKQKKGHSLKGAKLISNGKREFSKDYDPNTNYPTRFLVYPCVFQSNIKNKRLHPTQKPVPLLEYLIKTYTLENEVVLDNCMGSGSTGVACKNLNRKFIGIEMDEGYFEIAKKRINEH